MNVIKSTVSTTVVLLGSLLAISQVSKDSMQSLRQQKQSLELSTKINQQKTKLAKLENTLSVKTREMESSATSAQRSADDNASIAAQLSADPQDKKLARKAESAADDAKTNAKRGRVAASNLADLKKEIEALKGKIAEEEAKLAVNPLIVPAQQ